MAAASSWCIQDSSPLESHIHDKSFDIRVNHRSAEIPHMTDRASGCRLSADLTNEIVDKKWRRDTLSPDDAVLMKENLDSA